MNSEKFTPPSTGTASHRIEFFRLPAPGKRDPFFGLSRGWYCGLFSRLRSKKEARWRAQPSAVISLSTKTNMLVSTLEWSDKAAAAGEIKMVALRQRGALRGVRLVAYDSVCDYIRQAARTATAPTASVPAASQLPIAFEEP